MSIYVWSQPIQSLYMWVDDSPFTPTADTLAYYPLTSATTYSDLSGNNHTLSKRSGWADPTFWTYNWVDCVSYSSYWWLECSISFDTRTAWFTMLAWVYIDSNVSTSLYNALMWFTNSSDYYLATTGIWYKRWTGLSIWQWRWGWETIVSADCVGWHLIGFTSNNQSCIMYRDGVQIATRTQDLRQASAVLCMPYYRTSADGGFTGWMSNAIVETKTWTAQDFLDFYNATKSAYQS